MKERPILMSAPMVRALLEGRKTQTRRVVKPQPILVQASSRWTWQPNRHSFHVDASRPWWSYAIDAGDCPYQVDGRLWVRETWCYVGQVKPEPQEVAYRASIAPEHLPSWEGNWSPSIYMPRWASRITLQITNIRAERLQEISHKDAMAEGVEDEDLGSDLIDGSYAVTNYAALWDGLNAQRGYPWASNPFVWVLDLKLVTT